MMTLLKDPEWAKFTDREIARRCSVTHPFVGGIRASLVTVTSEKSARTYTNKHGQEATMNTGNIGKRDTGKKTANGRKLVLPAGRELAETRVERIRELAGAGHNAAQIAETIGVKLQHIGKLVAEACLGPLRLTNPSARRCVARETP
ncbi:MAG: hypothetical protein ACREP2_04810 [Rhodanobacteraceae bacterium]